jgi:hypothetical protein
MDNHEVLALAKKTGVMISGRPEFEESVRRLGKLIIKRVAPRPLTPTQLAYLEALGDRKSLQDLALQFGCTPQNALKMVRVLEARGLISKSLLFKRRLERGAWAYYYKKN